MSVGVLSKAIRNFYANLYMQLHNHSIALLDQKFLRNFYQHRVSPMDDFDIPMEAFTHDTLLDITSKVTRGKFFILSLYFDILFPCYCFTLEARFFGCFIVYQCKFFTCVGIAIYSHWCGHVSYCPISLLTIHPHSVRCPLSLLSFFLIA